MLGSRNHDTRVSTLLDQLEIKYTFTSDGDFKVVFEINDGRSQLAVINSNTERFGDFEIREVWSVAHRGEGPLSAALANQLLETNKRLKYGAWGIGRVGEQRVVVFTVHLAANSDAPSLFNGLKLALEAADELEQELTGDRDAF